jgi:hypothetical protein
MGNVNVILGLAQSDYLLDTVIHLSPDHRPAASTPLQKDRFTTGLETAGGFDRLSPGEGGGMPLTLDTVEMSHMETFVRYHRKQNH